MTSARPTGDFVFAVWLCMAPGFQGALGKVLPLEQMAAWRGEDSAMLATLAHHGRPIDVTDSKDFDAVWRPGKDGDPVAVLAALGAAVVQGWPRAFEAGGPALPATPEFWHGFAGLLMLADWIGSDTTRFPFVNGKAGDRLFWARYEAADTLQALGFDPARHRLGLPAVPEFDRVSPWSARPAQIAAGTIEGQVVVLEAETGSGKTEAALFRFARLFAAGEVDGLYFALPTRVAASAMFERVREAFDRVFDGATKPVVIRSVPGYAGADDAHVQMPPDFSTQLPAATHSYSPPRLALPREHASWVVSGRRRPR